MQDKSQDNEYKIAPLGVEEHRSVISKDETEVNGNKDVIELDNTRRNSPEGLSQ